MAQRVMAAMSGGVDSAVAALLLKGAGWDVTGVTMRMLSNADLPPERVPEGARTCCSLEDVEDARRVAFRLGIPYYVFNFTEEFHREVTDRFVASYLSGETPNPCVECNRRLKFGALLRRAEEADFAKLATGHYARVEHDAASGRWLLKKGLDPQKDQSYMLACLSQHQLSKTLFPLGTLTKAQVRALARAHDLANADKRDSQDICFVPDGDYGGFIRRYTGEDFLPGDFVGQQGEVYGRHRGLPLYTVGQRKGLGLSFPEPMYVTRLDPAQNRVVLGPSSALYTRSVRAAGLNFVAAADLLSPRRVTAKLRYRQPEQPALARQVGEDELLLTFDSPQRAPAPGQTVVLYEGDTVVASGEILPPAT